MKIDVTEHTDMRQKILDTETGRITEGAPVRIRCGDAFCPCQQGGACENFPPIDSQTAWRRRWAKKRGDRC